MEFFKMDLEEYESFMHSISESAGRVGLNSYNLYSDTCEQSQVDKWLISVSWKTSLDSWYILCSEDDPENLVRRFNYPFVVGTKEEIESYLRKAETVGAECFSKQSTAWNGFIQPPPQFMELSRVEQAEYAFHEAYHSTKKCFLGWEVQHLPSGSEEEARAFVAGHLSMVNYFKGSSLEEEAIQHFQKHLALANNTTEFYQELNNVYYSIVGKDGNVVSLEQKMKDREEMLLKAKSVFAEKLGKPINNAFFLYWYYFYGQVPRVYKRVEGLNDICKTIAILRGL